MIRIGLPFPPSVNSAYGNGGNKRGGENDIGLTHSIERFKIDPQLASILANTAERLGYAIK